MFSFLFKTAAIFGFLFRNFEENTFGANPKNYFDFYCSQLDSTNAILLVTCIFDKRNSTVTCILGLESL